MAYTSDELHEMTQSVLTSVRTNARTIEQLSVLSSLADTDYFEVHGGKRVSYEVIRALFQSMLDNELTRIEQIARRNSLKSVEIDVKGNVATLVIKSNAVTVSTVIPVVTDKAAGLMTVDQKAMLEMHDKAIGALQGKVAEIVVDKDELGKPRPTYVFRGPFDETADYFAGDVLNTGTFAYEVSLIERFGRIWACNVTGTHNPPSWLTSDWTFYMGESEFQIEFMEPQTLLNPRHFEKTLTIKAEKGGIDVTADILPQDVTWTRYSEDKLGNQRVESDNIWNLRRGKSGMAITLTQDDIDSGMGVPPVCIFSAEARLRDGSRQTTTFTAR